MKLALLKGNRFNPWHLQAYQRLQGDWEVVAFRAESEIQQHFHGRDDGSLGFAFEPIYFDTQKGPFLSRIMNTLREHYLNRSPRILPFYERLRDMDCILSWELFTDWSEQAAEARERYDIPLAIMVWDNIPFNQEMTAERRRIKAKVIEAADVFIVHTERSRRTLLHEGIDNERIRFVPPGVDLQHFSPTLHGQSQGAHGAVPGLAPDDFVILFVGWLLPRKGIDFLLLALRELANKYPKVHLLVVGSGPGRERVDALVKRLDLAQNITFAGSQPHSVMPEFYRAADVFVLPSIAMPDWQEQFGMSLIEAMACETPIISTYSGAIPEILGDTGILCQPNDFVSLHGALVKLLEEPEHRLSLAGYACQRAKKFYGLEQMAKKLSDILDTLVQQPSQDTTNLNDATLGTYP